MPIPIHAVKSRTQAHTRGTTRGEETVFKQGLEPGRETGTRTARDATSINPKAHDPVDPRMPYMPPP
jgi:hypothetical protein